MRASVRAASMASSSLTAVYSARPLFGEPRVLGADGRIIEARGNGMRGGDLAVGVCST